MQKKEVGLYLYCLYYGEDSLAVRGPRLHGCGRAQTGTPDLVGIDGDHEVFTLSKGSIHAAVSLVPLQEFGRRALEQRMGDLEWISRRALIHERVVEKIMAVHPVMPIRFGTIFAARDSIDKFLEIHHAKIIRFFSDTGESEEWGVKGYVNSSRLAEALKTGQPAARVIEESEGVFPGQAYLMRKKLAMAINDRRNIRAMQIAEDAFQGLLAQAVKGVGNKALQLEDGDETGSEMVLNGAFLVPKSNVGSFLACVNDTEERYRTQGLILSATGPWPPYNFCPSFGE